MLTALFVVIEVISAVAVVFLVLMHSGRGGGISDLLGGSMGSMAQGSTVVERNLDRVTIAVVLVFALSTITLDLRLQ